MAEPNSIASLKAYARPRVGDKDVDELAKAFLGESDRTVVVVLGSILEDVLASKIRSRLRPLSAEEEKALRLFAYDGPFGTFSTIINVAYALEIIDESLRRSLHDLREMRNACAHAPRPISFATPELANVCKRLFSEERDSLLALAADDQTSIRCAFEFKFVEILLTLVVSKQHALDWLDRAATEAAQPEASLDKSHPQPTPQDRGNQTAHMPQPPLPSSQASGPKVRRGKVRRPPPESTAGG